VDPAKLRELLRKEGAALDAVRLDAGPAKPSSKAFEDSSLQ
jgi:hypothetical protein